MKHVNLSQLASPVRGDMQLCKSNKTAFSQGFTIVELLIVIVVIGILASITIVSYIGISSKAAVASLQSDLINISTQLKVYQALNGQYPTGIDGNKCFIPASDNMCIKSSSNNTISSFTATGNNNTFCVTETNTNGVTYYITHNSAPISGSCPLDPANWLVIGTQTWGRYNLNVGVRLDGVNVPTNNSVLEKYCYNDTESNCTTYGGLYPWNEAMQYVTTNGAQGICPAGSHIPSDNDWKILEVQLGMTQAQADAIDWRGTNQGPQLQPSGSSGLNIPPAGVRNDVGYFSSLSLDTGLWSSSESSTSAWWRYLGSGFATVNRNTVGKGYGLSVRCLGN